MKKLKLNFDELKVESFTTNIEKIPKGTANGAAITIDFTCDLDPICIAGGTRECDTAHRPDGCDDSSCCDDD